ncbi:MAG: glutathione S-transferase family protein [Pseudomonadota bacterium]|nr:glutathione S-transferase family protein [Pseudomonadota bacterium]MEC8491337.1 glutathione S-transferase family protein [Pseudomonadota bacterium]
MNEEITIYGSGGNRAARVAWTVDELGLEVSYRHYDGMIGSDELRRLHPQAKIPAMQIGDFVLFESAPICQHLCDITLGQNLLAPQGAKERSLHNQWVSFAQSEIEAYLWHSFQLGRLELANSKTVAALALNRQLAAAGLDVLEQHLSDQDFILGKQFALTDIIVGWTTNWSRKTGLLESRPALQSYLARLFDRPHIALTW